MPTVIVKPTREILPFVERPVLVQLRKLWTDPWVTYPELIPITCRRAALHEGGSSFEFTRVYGPQTLDYVDKVYTDALPIDIRGWWVRVILLGAPTAGQPGSNGKKKNPPDVIFCGRVETETRDLHGTGQKPVGAAQNDPAKNQGNQTWVAAGPERILEKTEIYEAIWDQGGLVQRTSWMPSFNTRDRFGRLTGNKSLAKFSPINVPFQWPQSHIFEGRYNGSQRVWTNLEMLEYLIAWWLDKRATNGPQWTLAGQTQYLTTLREFISVSPSEDLMDLLMRIIPTAHGVSAYVETVNRRETNGSITTLGFEIRVFPLLGPNAQAAFAGYTFPTNQQILLFQNMTTLLDVELSVERGGSQLYDGVRLIARRVVSAFSAGHQAQNTHTSAWSNALQTAYKTAVSANAADAEKNDAYRADDYFRDVFQKFTVGGNFNWQNGAAHPFIRLDGSVDPNQRAQYQFFVGNTLGWLPLEETKDYTVFPPVGAGTGEVSYRPPLAMVLDPPTSRHIPVDQLSTFEDRRAASIDVLQEDMGLRLRSSPNHTFARGQWSGANPTEFDPDATETPGYEAGKVAFTIASETDQRLRVGQDLPPNQLSGLGLQKIIHDGDASVWWLAASTLVGASAAGAKVFSPAVGNLLRDDKDVLRRAMPGMINRFLIDRTRLIMRIRMVEAWSTMIGWIVSSFSEGGTQINIDAPLTAVEWDFVRRTTTLKAGQAR